MKHITIAIAFLLAGCSTATNPVAPATTPPAAPQVSAYNTDTLAVKVSVGTYVGGYYTPEVEWTFDTVSDPKPTTASVLTAGVKYHAYRALVSGSWSIYYVSPTPVTIEAGNTYRVTFYGPTSSALNSSSTELNKL